MGGHQHLGRVWRFPVFEEPPRPGAPPAWAGALGRSPGICGAATAGERCAGTGCAGSWRYTRTGCSSRGIPPHPAAPGPVIGSARSAGVGRSSVAAWPATAGGRGDRMGGQHRAGGAAAATAGALALPRPGCGVGAPDPGSPPLLGRSAHRSHRRGNRRTHRGRHRHPLTQAVCAGGSGSSSACSRTCRSPRTRSAPGRRGPHIPAADTGRPGPPRPSEPPPPAEFRHR